MASELENLIEEMYTKIRQLRGMLHGALDSDDIAVIKQQILKIIKEL